MAITSLASYVPTCDEFITHWGLVEAELGSAMLLQGGLTLTAFIALRDALEAKMTLIVGMVNAVDQAGSTRDTLRAAMRDRIRRFRAQVATLLPGTPYDNALPKLPYDGAAEGVMIDAMDDAANLWAQINADTTTPGFTAPLKLDGGNYLLAQFTTDVLAIRAAFKAWREADKVLEVERDKRDAMLEPIRTRMKQYQTACEANLPSGHALLLSIPLLSPAPGSTPDPVTLNGSWNVGLVMAQLIWLESTDPDLLSYKIRMTPGPTYDTGNDVQIGSVLAGTSSFDTVEGLSNPGDTASFRVYVMLQTGNEAASNTVVITRP